MTTATTADTLYAVYTPGTGDPESVTYQWKKNGTSAETPAAVTIAMNISDNWDAINTAVQYKGNYVVLDLSASWAAGNTIRGSWNGPTGNDMNIIKDNSSIVGVVLPDTLTNIGDSAFAYCTSLTSVTIPEGVTSIGFAAFEGCYGLTSVTIPEGVTSIDSYAFSGCSGLTGVTLPSSITSIGNYVFSGCSGLTEVTIPSSVTSIGNNAFYNCSGLTVVTFETESAISGANFGATNPFPGDLRAKYLAEGVGTYTRTAGGSTWTKQLQGGG